MKYFLSAVIALAFLAGARCQADDGTLLVQNPHGGYNVIQGGGRPKTIPFFGPHGYAAHVAAHAGDKPRFLVRSVLEDDGHGNKHLVPKKIWFRTPEEAEAARATTP